MKKSVEDADLVIESMSEDFNAKKELYQKMSPLLPEKTILVTNSSTMLPSRLAKYTGRPTKFLALHFANSIWKNNTAEVMKHETTENKYFDEVINFAKEINMIPLPLHKEKSGYLLNSMLIPLLFSGLDLLVNGISDGKSNYISLSPISYLGQKYYFDYVTEVFLYDHIPEGSYICSSTVNMGTNHILTKNSYCDVVIDAYQRGIIETSSVSDRNSETLLYRKNLKPVAIALINGKSPSAKELEYAKKYNLSFVMTQKQNSYIDKPVNFFSKKEIKYISDNKKESFYDGLLYLINYHKDDVYTGRKIMIISDIHAFLEPTIALLSYAKTQGITEIYSLGDNITVGPNPKEVLELLEKYNVQSIEGNSESYFLNDYKAFTYFDKDREDNCNWTLDKIGSRVNDLKYYPVSRQITVGNQKVGLILN